jgi:hypothetical protein
MAAASGIKRYTTAFFAYVQAEAGIKMFRVGQIRHAKHKLMHRMDR